MKQHAFDIKQLIKKSSHLVDLEELLVENGFEFESKKKLKQFLYAAWAKSNEDLILELQRKPLEKLDDISYTKIRRDGIVYKVHGIIHGQAPYGAKLKKEPRNFISDIVKSYENRPKEDYVLEVGFAEIFGLDESKEMDYIQEVVNRIGTKKTTIWFLKTVLTIPFWRFMGIIAKFSGFPELQNIYKSLDDIKYLTKARELNQLTKLPEPLNLELRLATGDENFVYSSEEMARYMLNYSKTNKLKILHGIVGLYHEPQVSYYLKKL